MDALDWSLDEFSALCRQLDCGSVVSANTWWRYPYIWSFSDNCVESGSGLKECVLPIPTATNYHEIACSGKLINV